MRTRKPTSGCTGSGCLRQRLVDHIAQTAEFCGGQCAAVAHLVLWPPRAGDDAGDEQVMLVRAQRLDGGIQLRGYGGVGDGHVDSCFPADC